MMELEKYELLALDLYSRIKEAVASSEVESWIVPEKKERFVYILNELIRDERNHAAMVHKHVGQVTKIR
jgi:hypothetical protein